MKLILIALAVAALQGQAVRSPAPQSRALDIDAVNGLLDKPGPPQVEPVFAKKSPWNRPDLTAWFGPIGGFFPERADRFSVSGAVVLQCAVSTTGKLSSCTTLIESPAGWGFPEAAMMIEMGYLTTTPAPGAKDGDQARILIPYTNHHKW